MKYREFKPTSQDVNIPFGDERDDWEVGRVSITRGVAGRALRAWNLALAALKKLDPKGEDHQVHRYNHWAVGWFEIVIARPGTRCARRVAMEEGEDPE